MRPSPTTARQHTERDQGTSFVITKKGSMQASQQHGFEGEGFAYLKSPVWWSGIITSTSHTTNAHCTPSNMLTQSSGYRRSRQLCSIRIRAADSGDAIGGAQCFDRVSQELGIRTHTDEVADKSRRAVLGSYFLGENLGTLGKLGCAICLIGSVVIVLHAPPDKEIQTIDEILNYAVQPGELPSRQT